MKVLLVITPYSPLQTPNTLRWNAIAKELQKYGCDVTVLTTKVKDSLIDIDNLSVLRTGYNTLLEWLKFHKPTHDDVHSRSSTKKPTFFRNALEKCVDLFWRNNYWPDGSVLFLKPGKKAIDNILQTGGFTHVISVGTPFTCHLIALHAKKKKNELFWLMDVQDPFSISDEFRINNFKRYKKKNIKFEKLCLAFADCVVFTNRSVEKIYKNLYEAHEEKFNVVPPLLKVEKSQSQKELNPDKIKMVYCGSFYEVVRSPKPFLKFMQFIWENEKTFFDNKSIHIYCELNPFVKSIVKQFPDLDSIIHFHGFIDHAQAHSKNLDANFIFNFGNTTSYHLPSKVVELLYFNKPIVNIASRSDDATAEFLENKSTLLNLNLDTEAFQKAFTQLKVFIDENRTMRLSPNDTVLEDYGAEKITNAYFQLMNPNLKENKN